MKQSSESPVWHNHSSHSLQYHVDATRRWLVSRWRAQGSRGQRGPSLLLSSLMGKWRNGSWWITDSPQPLCRRLQYSPIRSLASCRRKDLKSLKGQEPDDFKRIKELVTATSKRKKNMYLYNFLLFDLQR